MNAMSRIPNFAQIDFADAPLAAAAQAAPWLTPEGVAVKEQLRRRRS